MTNITKKIIEEMGKYTHHYQQDIVGDLEKMAAKNGVYYLMLRDCGTYAFARSALAGNSDAFAIWSYYENFGGIHAYKISVEEICPEETFIIRENGTGNGLEKQFPVLLGKIREIDYQETVEEFRRPIDFIENMVTGIVRRKGGFREKDIFSKMVYFKTIEKRWEHWVIGVYGELEEDKIHRKSFNVDLVTGKLC